MKSAAILCTLAWSAFWVFGGIALLTPPDETVTLLTATIVSAAGLVAGVVLYVGISRAGGA
ncbi:hypothetical protein [Anianabacter salinae]|uniref:hypothetical protein n=1 Tax=Anianabacter salinae TaxID=2851023 RepID=UPI00225DEBCB|nr:hypothetical protein [Anianabacter salinae]MBV0913742.1 hypothetical protein [Anianabacter salinae]